MKKRTIWILGTLMSFCFLGLLFLQINYMEEVAKMRNEQFDESVKRALYQASRNLERDETLEYLEEDLNLPDEVKNSTAANSPFFSGSVDLSDFSSDFNLDLMNGHFPQYRSSSNWSTGRGGIFSKSNRRLRETLKERYRHQRDVLDEVIISILSTASSRDLRTRVNFRNLDGYLKSELLNNGIDLPYHFKVTDRNGHEVYRCPDYDEAGSEDSYMQVLYPNDPPARLSYVTVHFPMRRDYIVSSLTVMTPALIFTVILLILFLFIMFSIFRQKKLSEMKNDFINNMTHEFKTPISSISLAAQMLQDPDVAKSPAMLKHATSVINDETKRLRFQVEKVLQMSMFERRGAATLHMKELSANGLIESVVHTFRLKVEQYGGSIETQTEAEDDIIYVDEMHFTNVIFNLLDNAVKYRKPDTPLHLHIATRNDATRLYITIRDNGIGIKKEDCKKVFEKFYRVHTGNRHDVKGFGLGLAYVKKMIAEHKGSIRVDSELGEGSTFTITLPLLGEDDGK